MCELITKVASVSSITSSDSSLITVSRSKRDKIGSVRSTLSLKFKAGLYTPPIGFAAAITEQRAYKDVTIPALEIEIDYCSIAS